jgi:putative chitinase
MSAMASYAINTTARQAAFLAQIGHESGRLQFVREIWNPAQCPWQAEYEGRKNLGNTTPGDGERYKGRGLIQITGRANYAACSTAIFGYPTKLLNYPEMLEQYPYAAQSAGWFWASRGCNELADAGDFRGITKHINGGLNGYADRLALLKSATDALNTLNTLKG